MRERLEQVVETNDDPAVRQWARALVESVGADAPDAETREWAARLLEQLGPASATKRATEPEQSRGVRSYLEYLARNDPNPTVRLRAEAVLDRGRRPA